MLRFILSFRLLYCIFLLEIVNGPDAYYTHYVNHNYDWSITKCLQWRRPGNNFLTPFSKNNLKLSTPFPFILVYSPEFTIDVSALPDARLFPVDIVSLVHWVLLSPYPSTNSSHAYPAPPITVHCCTSFTHVTVKPNIR